jgi:hypothetical protein
MKRTLLILGVIVLAACGIFSSCNKDSDEQKGMAKVNVHLTDGPADYDAILIDVQRVEINSDVSGWVSVPAIAPGVYNLLDFSNGMDTLLINASLPAGHISQMRLVLGNNNSIVVNGVSHPLSTPSAQQSGLKFNIHQELVANGSYDIWIDFDAGKSIVEQGNGGYSLKPVIRTYTALTNGKIKGFVLPAQANAVVYAIHGTDTFSAIPAIDGYFMFSGMPEGTYSLWFDAASNTGFQDLLQPNVTVSFGVITDVGIITLLP